MEDEDEEQPGSAAFYRLLQAVNARMLHHVPRMMEELVHLPVCSVLCVTPDAEVLAAMCTDRGTRRLIDKRHRQCPAHTCRGFWSTVEAGHIAC